MVGLGFRILDGMSRLGIWRSKASRADVFFAFNRKPQVEPSALFLKFETSEPRTLNLQTTVSEEDDSKQDAFRAELLQARQEIG